LNGELHRAAHEWCDGPVLKIGNIQTESIMKVDEETKNGIIVISDNLKIIKTN